MPEEKQKEPDKFIKETHLNEKERELFEFVNKREEELRETKEDIFGTNLEDIMREADSAYVPHRLKTKGKKVLVADEDEGWRSAFVDLNSEDKWQSDVAQANPFIKIQVALGILVDRNPEGVLTPNSTRFEATTAMMSQLYKKSWQMAKSKQQLKLFVFNLAKYGWACGRSYPLKLNRPLRNEDLELSDKTSTPYNDVFRENLDPWHTWIDDGAKPSNPNSVNDWCWDKTYSYDGAKEEFGDSPLFKYVKGIKIEGEGEEDKEKKHQREDQVLAKFYESLNKDLFMVKLNDIPVIIKPLPIEDNDGNKKLSLWQTYWSLRHAESPYGIGIYEAMRYDQGLLDRIRNMTIDQLTLSIYKFFLFQGTDMMTDTGKIKISPGKGKQVINPKNVNWMEVPGPGAEAWNGIDFFKKAVDDVTGITPTLMGEVTGKTAFEVAQAKESALKRLKTPLDNVTDALEDEGYITLCLIQMIYSVPELIKITDSRLIEAYLEEIKGDQALYGRDEQGEFIAKVFREMQLGLEEDNEGKLVETEKNKFLRIKPKFLKWNGMINIKGQSILSPSKELSKALDLELVNILVPLLGQPPEMVMKTAKQILKVYDKDTAKWLPESWLADKPTTAGQPMIVPAKGGGGQPQPAQPTGQGAGSKIMNGIKSAVNSFRR